MSKLRVDPALLFVAVLAAVSGGLCLYLKGWAGVARAADTFAGLAIQIAPLVVIAVLMAGFIQALVSRERVSRWLGTESGMRGILLASVAGAITPGGPWISFPLVVALSAAGADRGAMVAYITAWTAIAMHRTLVWEIPLMGGEFAFVRVLASLPLPIIAGLIARQLPLRFTPPGSGNA